MIDRKEQETCQIAFDLTNLISLANYLRTTARESFSSQEAVLADCDSILRELEVLCLKLKDLDIDEEQIPPFEMQLGELHLLGRK
jgi:hypothetical protein